MEVESATDIKAGRPPIIESFSISGLYGYRTISLEARNAATILIAKNGSGKTTLLGVLNAFLLGQYVRLKGLEFDSISCRLRGIESQLLLTKKDIEQALAPPESGDFLNFATKINVKSIDLFRFVLEEWPAFRRNRESAFENPIYSAIVRETGYLTLRADKLIDDLQLLIYQQNSNVSTIFSSTRTALEGCDVLYLPTYRRIELALRGDVSETRNRRKSLRLELASNGLFTGDIQFGLSDISDRLKDINEKIVYDSNNQYRKISADIINDLIDGTYEKADSSVESIPTKEDLELLFSRVEQGRRGRAHFPPVSVPNLAKIFSEEGIPKSSEKFLKYFLGQLGKVINSTKEAESRVQEFIDRCNDYLSMEQPSTGKDAEEITSDLDGKKLILNKRNLQVHVVSTPGERKVSLDALSSGEKQMISLFAKLFLYESPKIVLIDEPELSLSIEWQRKILVDIVQAPMCSQLVAITHSPFVFDNQLEAFAGALKLSATHQVSLPTEDEEKIFEDDNFDE